MSSLSTNAGEPRKKNFSNGSGLLSEAVTKTVTYESGAPPVVSSAGNFLSGVDRKIYYGRDIPDFHRRKASGELLPYTAYSRLDAESSTVQANNRIYGTPPYRSYQVLSAPHDFALRSDIEPYVGYREFNLMYEALVSKDVDPKFFVQKAAAQLYGSGFDALTFVGEFHQTVRMFKSVSGKMVDLLRLALNELKPADLLKFPNWWLEARYGWRILTYDIQDVTTLIYSLDKKAKERYKKRSGASFEWTATQSHTFDGGSAYYDTDVIENHTLGVRGSIITDFAPPRFSLNPVVTAWELVKFSFVVDWFWDVGQMLEATSFAILSDTYTAAWGCEYSLHREHNLDWRPYLPTTNGTFNHQITEDITMFRRRPITVPSTPFSVNRLDPLKIVDTTSLIIQLAATLYKKLY